MVYRMEISRPQAFMACEGGSSSRPIIKRTAPPMRHEIVQSGEWTYDMTLGVAAGDTLEEREELYQRAHERLLNLDNDEEVPDAQNDLDEAERHLMAYVDDVEVFGEEEPEYLTENDECADETVDDGDDELAAAE